MALKNVNWDQTDYHTYFNDFDTYVAGDWTVTEVGSGSRALTNVDGGCLLITNAAGDDDHNYMQKVGESFLFEAGKPMYFEARVKVSDATQSDMVLGLLITDTSPLATVTDGIYFQKDDGDTNIDFHVVKNSTATDSTAVATLDTNFNTYAFYYDGSRSQIEILFNDVIVGTSVLTNVSDDEELTITMAVQNGEAVAKIMTVDYIFCAKARIAQ